MDSSRVIQPGPHNRLYPSVQCVTAYCHGLVPFGNKGTAFILKSPQEESPALAFLLRAVTVPPTWQWVPAAECEATIPAACPGWGRGGWRRGWTGPGCKARERRGASATAKCGLPPSGRYCSGTRRSPFLPRRGIARRGRSPGISSLLFCGLPSNRPTGGSGGWKGRRMSWQRDPQRRPPYAHLRLLQRRFNFLGEERSDGRLQCMAARRQDWAAYSTRRERRSLITVRLLNSNLETVKSLYIGYKDAGILYFATCWSLALPQIKPRYTPC